ncbi:MAG: nicotinate-nucleotide adenylyltransferase [Gammaproteobacteria bacterium]|nr:nicotinate-nucleotide adenylyltransferase [Gammaproteobacteria bacterium]
MTNKIADPLGILGGTFDPIHNGHLQIAASIIDATSVNTIKFMPCYLPVHRPEPESIVNDRVAMIKLALESSSLSLDEREIRRKSPSYMIDSLISLREDFPLHPLCLILGADAYQNIITWKKWQELLEYAHLIIINRPHFPFKLHPHPLLAKHETQNPNDIRTHLAGSILFLAIPPCPISATSIRQKIKNNEDITALVPRKVADYIHQHDLYRND